MKTAFSRLFLVMLTAILLSACTSNEIYRSNFSNCIVTAQESCESHAIQLHNKGTEREYLL
ncbi:MAG: esterase, partial [Nitrosomonas sp. PRO5]|nr:esterase [Nitrosomonas sp. PRO5]